MIEKVKRQHKGQLKRNTDKIDEIVKWINEHWKGEGQRADKVTDSK